MGRPVHFEIPAEDPEKAIQFYQTVFGWTIQKWDGPMPYWLITTGPSGAPGINGGLMKRHHPEQPCVNTIDVENLDESVQTVLAAGGQIALPKMPVPGVGWLAYCKDLDGHIFGMMQADPSAGGCA
ncbi:MAG: VOC family protein [Acidobacteria bacterium]|nr:VOC family protein [Acidobacteriota bacterium]